MKIIIVGATGTIGKRVTDELSKRHEVIKASATRGDILVDISLRESIAGMYKQAGALDAVVSTVGDVYFGDFNTMKEEGFYIGIRINVVSPGVVEDAEELFPFFPGHTPVLMERVVGGYVKSVEGKVNGEIIRIY